MLESVIVPAPETITKTKPPMFNKKHTKERLVTVRVSLLGRGPKKLQQHSIIFRFSRNCIPFVLTGWL